MRRAVTGSGYGSSSSATPRWRGSTCASSPPAPPGSRRGNGRDGDALGPGEEFAITVDFVRSPASVQGVAQIGRPSVLHATAAGKVLLAFRHVPLPGDELRASTKNTIVVQQQLEREIARFHARVGAGGEGA